MIKEKEKLSYCVRRIEFGRAVIDFISGGHYTKSVPTNVKLCFGLFENDSSDILLGAITFSRFMRTQQEKKYPNSLELSRVYLLDQAPKNSESYFISRCLKYLKKETEYYSVVSYADPTEGHSGVIYRACNFEFVGKTNPSYHYEWPSGVREHKYGPWRKAKLIGISEHEYARVNGLKKIIESPKNIFIYHLRKRPKIQKQENSWEIISEDSSFLKIKFKNGVVKIDKDEFDLFKSYNWYLGKSGYLQAKSHDLRTISFHREVMRAPPGIIVDHINRDRFDNTKSNLRFSNNSLNQANSSIKGKYRGIKLSKGKWEASITKNGVRRYLGRFLTAEEAAMAYDLAAKELFGVFANTNFKNDSEFTPDLLEKDLLSAKVCVVCGDGSGDQDKCHKHRVQRRKYKPRILINLKKCKICGEETFSRNLCLHHYYAEKKSNGEPIRHSQKKKYLCKVDGCTTFANHISDRLCQKHWRIENGIKKKPIGRPVTTGSGVRDKLCSIDGCESKASFKGSLCYKHRGLSRDRIGSVYAGQWLRDLRVSVGMSAINLSKMIGYSNESVVCLFEKGKKTLSYESICKICEVFNLDQESVYGLLKDHNTKRK